MAHSVRVPVAHGGWPHERTLPANPFRRTGSCAMRLLSFRPGLLLSALDTSGAAPASAARTSAPRSNAHLRRPTAHPGRSRCPSFYTSPATSSRRVTLPQPCPRAICALTISCTPAVYGAWPETLTATSAAARRHVRQLPTLLALSVVLAGAGGLTGCSGKLPTQHPIFTLAGTYTVQISATDGILVRKVTYTVTVKPD